MQKLSHVRTARGSQAGCEVRNLSVRQIPGQRVQHPVAHTAGDGGLRVAGARPYDEIVRPETRHYAKRILGTMLPVAIDDEHEFTRGASDPGLDGRTVALVVWMRDHDGTSVARARGRVIGRSIVDDENLPPRRDGLEV